MYYRLDALLMIYSQCVVHFRSLLRYTPRSLNDWTDSIGHPPMYNGDCKGKRYCKGSNKISLHFFGLRHIFLAVAKFIISFTIMGIILGEHLGITSATDKSSINLILNSQLSTKGLTSIANSNGPSFVPRGIPPLTFLYSDVTLFILTHCMRLVRKDFTHLTKAGWISKRAISELKTLWSTRSNPFLKSAKKARTEQYPLSNASKMLWRKYTKAWVVEWPLVVNWNLSRDPSRYDKMCFNLGYLGRECYWNNNKNIYSTICFT